MKRLIEHQTITTVVFSGRGAGHARQSTAHYWTKKQWKAEDLRGKPIRIYLPPKLANPLWWKCDAKFCYELLVDDVVKLTGDMPDRKIHCCEHQLELD